MGHNAHSQSYVNHPASGFDAIGDIVSCMFDSASGSGRRRRQNVMDNTIKDTVESKKSLQDAIRNCRKRNNLDILLFRSWTIDDVLKNVEICPPSWSQALKDARFVQDPDRSTCIVQKFAYSVDVASVLDRVSFHFVQQCCYSQG